MKESHFIVDRIEGRSLVLQNRNAEITHRHKRNHQIQYFYRRILTKYDNRRKDHQNDRRIKWRNRKCIFKRCSHRITDYLTDPAPADQT